MEYWLTRALALEICTLSGASYFPKADYSDSKRHVVKIRFEDGIAQGLHKAVQEIGTLLSKNKAKEFNVLFHLIADADCNHWEEEAALKVEYNV